MDVTAKALYRTMSMLGAAAVIGVTAATLVTCGVGLAHGTDTWCALPLSWLFGFPLAIVAALVFGLPLALLCWKLRLARWWQFGLAGLVCSLPIWLELAQPFVSARWAQSGLYDSLNYLGSGVAGGLAYWCLSRKLGMASTPDGMVRDRH